MTPEEANSFFTKSQQADSAALPPAEDDEDLVRTRAYLACLSSLHTLPHLIAHPPSQFPLQLDEL